MEPCFNTYDCNKHNLLLNINPIKNCCVSPNQGICNQFKEQQLNQYCCNNMYGMPKGTFVGRPLRFDYTPESDRNWQNKRCQQVTPCGCAKQPNFIPQNNCSCPKYSPYFVN